MDTEQSRPSFHGLSPLGSSHFPQVIKDAAQEKHTFY